MSKRIVLLDAHVHVYPGADVAGLLSAAAKNFSATAAAVRASQWHGMLMLTEVAGVEWFDYIAEVPGGHPFGPWRVAQSAADPNCLEASTKVVTMTIVAGRQINTAERIEVHALCTREKFADGIATRTTLDEVQAAGALAVLPWGVGKWLGRRGRMVEEMLGDSAGLKLYASDNGGRPAFWREKLFSLLGERPLLRGSDPLPLSGEEYRVGEFGSWWESALPAETSAKAFLDEALSMPHGKIRAYGPNETAGRFLRNQLLLRLNRRLP